MISGFIPVISAPCHITCPEEGISNPARRLSSVVFPDPFGPKMPIISPRRISKETEETANRPPNLLVRLSTLRNMAPAPQKSNDAAQHQEDRENQNGAISRDT